MKDSIMLPTGYGLNTYIFDKEGNPWKATRAQMPPIYEIERVENITERELLAQGIPYLKSEK